MCANITSDIELDVYGPLDYIVRYAPNQPANYSYDKYKEYIDAVLTAIIAKGKGIEVNSSGLKYGMGFTHPHKDIVKRYLELGGTIVTIGSDAHIPEHIAYDFELVKGMLLELGMTSYTVFRKRVGVAVELV